MMHIPVSIPKIIISTKIMYHIWYWESGPIGNNPVVSGAQMLRYRPAYIPNSFPTGRKAEMRQWVDLTNEAQHGGTCEVSLEHTEEKSSVDRPNPVCSFHIRAKSQFEVKLKLMWRVGHTERNLARMHMQGDTPNVRTCTSPLRMCTTVQDTWTTQCDHWHRATFCSFCCLLAIPSHRDEYTSGSPFVFVGCHSVPAVSPCSLGGLLTEVLCFHLTNHQLTITGCRKALLWRLRAHLRALAMEAHAPNRRSSSSSSTGTSPSSTSPHRLRYSHRHCQKHLHHHYNYVDNSN